METRMDSGLNQSHLTLVWIQGPMPNKQNRHCSHHCVIQTIMTWFHFLIWSWYDWMFGSSSESHTLWKHMNTVQCANINIVLKNWDNSNLFTIYTAFILPTTLLPNVFARDKRCLNWGDLQRRETGQQKGMVHLLWNMSCCSVSTFVWEPWDCLRTSQSSNERQRQQTLSTRSLVCCYLMLFFEAACVLNSFDADNDVSSIYQIHWHT